MGHKSLRPSTRLVSKESGLFLEVTSVRAPVRAQPEPHLWTLVPLAVMTVWFLKLLRFAKQCRQVSLVAVSCR